MSRRLNKSERQFILTEMLELARFLTGKSVPPPTIREAVKRLRDDLTKMIREGVIEITDDRESYVPALEKQP